MYVRKRLKVQKITGADSLDLALKGTVQRKVTGVESVRYPSIDIFKLSGWPFSFFHFKGTPSREEHKTVHSVFTTIESDSTG